MLVAGSVNADVVVEVDRAPLRGETLLANRTTLMPGGKGANQAVASARFGADTALIGCIGDDPFASICEEFLRQSGVSLHYLRKQRTTSTGTAIVLLEKDGNNRIIVAPGANATLDQDDLRGVQIEPGDVLLAQLEIPVDTVVHFMQMGAVACATTVLNVSPAVVIDRDLLRLPTILIFNESEFELQSGTRLADPISMDSVAKKAVGMMGDKEQTTIITLGAHGAMVVKRDEWKHIPARPADVVDTTGAGDCFAGVLAAAMAEGLAMDDAVEIASAAAAICVGRLGTGPAMPDRTEIWSLIKERTA